MNWQIEHMYERYQERMREITHLRLVRVGGVPHTLEVGMGGKTLAWLGHRLVAAGEQLQAYAVPRA